MFDFKTHFPGLCIVGLVTVSVAWAQDEVVPDSVAQSGLLGELILDEFYATAKSRTLRSEKEIVNMLGFNTAKVERTSGKGEIAPLTEAMPRLQMLIAGKGIPEQTKEVVVGVEGLRFVPAHVLLPQKGIVTLVNRQNIPISVKTTLSSADSFQLAEGQKKALSFEPGEHFIWLEGFPHARLEVLVLKNAMQIDFDWETGVIAATPVAPGAYQLGFYLGARPLHIQPVTVPEEGALQIAATVSANEIVTVSVTMGVILSEESGDAGILDEDLGPETPAVNLRQNQNKVPKSTLSPDNSILPAQPTTTSP